MFPFKKANKLTNASVCDKNYQKYDNLLCDIAIIKNKN